MRTLICRTLAAGLLASSAAQGVAAATLNLIDVGNRLLRVDSAAPGTIANTVVLTGLRTGDTLLGFDYRPASPRVLYGLGTSGQLYAINPVNGSAAAVGTPSSIFGFAAGVDFNPVVDRLRVVTNTANNYRINPTTGVALTDTQIAYAIGDTGVGIAPRTVASAYANNFAGAATTTLYVIDANRGVLAIQGSPGGTPVSPNSGQLTTVGSLGVVTNDSAGFDISRDGLALATLTQPGTGTTSLYSINLATGAATLIGRVGTPGHTYLGLSIAPPPIASYGATANQIAVGAALDNFVGVPSAALNGLFNTLDGLAPGDRAGALSQLTPAAYSLLPELTLRTTEVAQGTLQRYLRDFRDHAAGIADGDSRIGGFLVTNGGLGHYDAATDRARVTYGDAGILAGIDYRIGDRLLIGITGGYDDARVRLGDNVPNSKIRNYFGGGYATLTFGPAYIDVFGTYGEADYDLLRNVQFSDANLGFAATTHSSTYMGGGTVGLKFALGHVVLEPYAGARYARVILRGFSDGLDLGALTLGNSQYDSVLGNFGVKLGGSFEVGGATVRPEIRGAYRHEFQRDGERAFTYGFGGTGAPVQLPFTPTPLQRSYATVGAGFTVSGVHSPLSLVVDYNGDYGSDRKISSINGGIRYAF